LVWAFPRLSYKFNQRMIPSIEPKAVAKDGQPRAISPVQVDVAAAADTFAGGAAPAATTATTNTNIITSAPVKALAYVSQLRSPAAAPTAMRPLSNIMVLSVGAQLAGSQHCHLCCARQQALPMLTCVCCLLLQVAHSPVSEVVFHLAWDQIVTDLRLRDLLSDAEAGSLKYTHLSWGRNRETAWLLLPRYSYAPYDCSAHHSSEA